MLDKIPSDTINSHILTYFQALVSSFLKEIDLVKDYKNEWKMMFNFEKTFNLLCKTCVLSHRTSLLNELLDLMNKQDIFPKSGHPSEIILRLIVVAFARSDNRKNSLIAYKHGCDINYFPSQPDSVRDNCLVVTVPSNFTEPEISILLTSFFYGVWLSVQAEILPDSNLPSIMVKIVYVKSKSQTVPDILQCSQSEDNVLRRVRNVLTEEMNVRNEQGNGLIKFHGKELEEIFHSTAWKQTCKNWPEFQAVVEKIKEMKSKIDFSRRLPAAVPPRFD